MIEDHRPSRSRGGKRAGTVVVGVGLLAALGIWLKGVIPGLGGDNSPSSVTAHAPKEPKAAPAKKGKTATLGEMRHVLVKGEECIYETEEPAACDVVCVMLTRDGTDTLHVAIDATDGAHGVVEGLETCLKDRGVKNIHLRNR